MNSLYELYPPFSLKETIIQVYKLQSKFRLRFAHPLKGATPPYWQAKANLITLQTIHQITTATITSYSIISQERAGPNDPSPVRSKKMAKTFFIASIVRVYHDEEIS